MNPIKRTLRHGRAGLLLFLATAMVLALGAAGTAAGLVTGRNIQDDSVTGRDLRDATVTSADVRNGSLAPRDYTGAVVGAPGPQGPTGPAGPTGPQGSAGVVVSRYVVASTDPVPPNMAGGADAHCPFGTRVLSGGIRFTDTAAAILHNAPSSSGGVWSATFLNEGTSELTGEVWAICARV